MNDRMKLSLTQLGFFSHPTEKWVGCKVHYKVNGPKRLLKDLQNFVDTHKTENVKLEDDIVAYAHLDPMDNFDLETGKRVARAKVESMAYNRIWGLFDRYCDYMQENANTLDAFVETASTVMAHNRDYIDQF